MAYWKTGYRKVNGKRRKVRKLVEHGKVVSVRIFGKATYTDKTAKKYHLHRKKKYWNMPKSAKRHSHRG